MMLKTPLHKTRSRIIALMFFLSAALHAFSVQAAPVDVSGTLKGASGRPVTGKYLLRVQTFSFDSGGTPLGEALESETLFDAEGKFKFPLPIVDLNGSTSSTYVSIMADLDRNGLDGNDYILGSYYARRRPLSDAPFDISLPARESTHAVAGETTAPVSKINSGYDLNEAEHINVRKLGAAGDGTHDDTQVIQHAINYLRKTGGGEIYFPRGSYRITQLDLTNSGGIRLRGASQLSTRLVGGVAGAHLLDLTGSAYCQIENLTIVAADCGALSAIFLGQNQQWSGNAAHFDNLYISGKYSLATIYNTGFQSSDMINCDLYNYDPSSAPVLYFSKPNAAHAKSLLSEMAPEAIITSDWTFTACEMHSFAAQHGGPSSAPTVILDGVEQIRWVGGNISGSGPEYVLLRGKPRWIEFHGTTFYSDNGTPAKANFKIVDGIQGLTIGQCHMQVAESIIEGGDGAQLEAIHFSSFILGSPPYLLRCNGGTLADSFMLAGGRAVLIGEVHNSQWVNPGEITKSPLAKP